MKRFLFTPAFTPVEYFFGCLLTLGAWKLLGGS